MITVVEEKVDHDGETQAKVEYHTIRTRAKAVRKSNVDEMVSEQLMIIGMEMDRLNERLGRVKLES